MDAAYLFSGSDDTNVRMWRAVANERSGKQTPREQKKREYSAALVEKFKYMPEVKRIKNHAHLPKRIMRAADVKETVAGTQRKREKNRRAHSAAGSVPKVSRKKKSVWRVQE
jgi:WD repeat and SOF domain-containing protein 1